MKKLGKKNFSMKIIFIGIILLIVNTISKGQNPIYYDMLSIDSIYTEFARNVISEKDYDYRVKILRTPNDSLDIYRLSDKAEFLFEKGDCEKSIFAWERVIQNSTNKTDTGNFDYYYYNLAMARICKKDFEGALSDVKKSLKFRPNFLPAIQMKKDLENTLYSKPFVRPIYTSVITDTTLFNYSKENNYNAELGNTIHFKKFGSNNNNIWKIYFDTNKKNLAYETRFKGDTLFQIDYYEIGHVKLMDSYIKNGRSYVWLCHYEGCENGQKIINWCPYLFVNKTLITRYYCNGNKRIEYTQFEDKWDGLFTEWYENGFKKEQVNFINNNMEGEKKYWDNKGNLIKIELYQSGVLKTPPQGSEKSPLSH